MKRRDLLGAGAAMAAGAALRAAPAAGNTDAVRAVAFSRDGTRVLTGSFDNTARLWSVFKSPQDLVNTVRTTVPRCLTPIERQAFHIWGRRRRGGVASVISGPSPIMASHIPGGGEPPYGHRQQLGMKSCSPLGINSVRGSAAHRPTRLSLSRHLGDKVGAYRVLA